MAVTKLSLLALHHMVVTHRWLLLGLSLLPILVVAESSLQLHTHYYSMGKNLSIIKPSVHYENSFSVDSKFNARFTVDRVSNEAVDSVSSASQSFVASEDKVDIRQEVTSGYSHTLGLWKFGLGYVFSLEQDYRSHTPSIGLSRDFNMRNTTLGLLYAHNVDQVKGSYMEVAEDKRVNNLALSLTQVLHRSSLVSVAYTLQNNQGYLATGNRQIMLDNGLLSDEYLPSQRLRQAVGLRFIQWLPLNAALHLAYRYYVDDWELSSHTIESQLYQSLGSGLKLRYEYRYYNQQAVYFSQDSYDGTEKYLTAANSLQAFNSYLFGVKLSYQAQSRFGDWQIETKYERYRQSSGLGGSIMMMSLSHQW
ncbi:MAG: DUF3570 domain-containing protein [Gammaproteobacteria bacterium]|nr:DUF3570 domain-containing protein [Gammaproteobacteria bacterium]MDH5731822.1 DUF3570 domain-containing protein [Gammaproteobacteria bacterium]